MTTFHIQSLPESNPGSRWQPIFFGCIRSFFPGFKSGDQVGKKLIISDKQHAFCAGENLLS
jgi:hypothetical protein